MIQEACEDFSSCQWEAGSHVCLLAIFGTELFLPLAERLIPSKEDNFQLLFPLSQASADPPG